MKTRSDMLMLKLKTLDIVNVLYKNGKLTAQEANILDEAVVELAETYDKVYCNSLEFAQIIEEPFNGGQLNEYNKNIANILRKMIGAPHE